MKKLIISLLLFVGFSFGNELNIITDAEKYHTIGLFADFTKKTGIKVNVTNVPTEMLNSRLARSKEKFDIVLSQDVVVLESLKGSNLLAKNAKSLNSSKIPDQFRDSEDMWMPFSYRARVMVFNVSKLSYSKLNGYTDLAALDMNHKVCVRPLNHSYNVTLLSAMIVDKGVDFATEWAKGLKSNLAVSPQGNDRKQIELVSKGVCDLTMINTYYYGMVMTDPKMKDFATNTQIFFPDISKKGKGPYVLVSGIAVLNNSRSPQNMKDIGIFYEYILSVESQKNILVQGFEYPIIEGPFVSDIVSVFGKGQEGIVNGKTKVNVVSPSAILRVRSQAQKIMDSLMSSGF